MIDCGNSSGYLAGTVARRIRNHNAGASMLHIIIARMSIVVSNATLKKNVQPKL